MISKNRLYATTYEIAQMIIHDKYLNEEVIYDLVWDIMKEHFDKWENIIPTKWPINYNEITFGKDISFSKGNTDLITPIILTTIAATLTHLMKSDERITDPLKIGNIIKEYAYNFGAPVALANHLAMTVPSIMKTDYIYSDMALITEEKYIVITNDAPESKIISKRELEFAKNDEETIYIHNTRIYFKRYNANVSETMVEFLKILLRNPQEVFSYKDLEEKITGATSKPEKARDYMNKVKHRLCTALPELSDYIEVHDGYCLIEPIKYCVYIKRILVNEKNE